MSDNELKTIYGGAFNFTVTFFNAISRYIMTVKGLGETIGSSIRRIFKKSIC
ncbi:MAG: bacteriocin [Bacilli bacterium]|nr:bacteriocin [Bacilli bacterium]